MKRDFIKKSNLDSKRPSKPFTKRRPSFNQGAAKTQPADKKMFEKKQPHFSRDSDWSKRGNTWRAEPSVGSRNQPKADMAQKERENEQLKASAIAKLGPGGFSKFGDIPAHKLGRALRGKLYQIANGLPADESNNLSSRIKYAATTVTSTLATGFGERIFRSVIGKSLESRGALFSIQDHLEQLSDQKLMDEKLYAELQADVDAAIVAINEYLGLLVKEQNRFQENVATH